MLYCRILNCKHIEVTKQEKVYVGRNIITMGLQETSYIVWPRCYFVTHSHQLRGNYIDSPPTLTGVGHQWTILTNMGHFWSKSSQWELLVATNFGTHKLVQGTMSLTCCSFSTNKQCDFTSIFCFFVLS